MLIQIFNARSKVVCRNDQFTVEQKAGEIPNAGADFQNALAYVWCQPPIHPATVIAGASHDLKVRNQNLVIAHRPFI
jgi:hypothetical protein